MKLIAKFLAAATIAAAALIIAPRSISAQGNPPDLPREFRGVWVATVSNIDWPIATSNSTSKKQTDLTAIMDLAVQMKMNAIVLQVRPACDAFYSSSIEPWSRWMQGTQGTNPGWDPLTFAINAARARGLEVHAWFNPYRASSNVSGPYASSHIINTSPTLVRTYGTQRWLDPGMQEVQDHTYRVIADVVTRYDIDAVHFDDYFYPYQVTDTTGTVVDFPDSTSYATYQSGGGLLSKNNWRRDNVNRFVQRVNTGIKGIKSKVRFGISPFGIWRPGNPSGITGLDAYATLYADSRLWLQSGWVDYLAPQLYWEINNSGQEFPKLLTWWTNSTQNPLGRHVFAGQYTSQVGTSASWTSTEILNQINLSRTTPGSNGNIHFSQKALRNDQSGIRTALLNGPYATWALPPAATWVDSLPPQPPTVTFTRNPINATITLNWTPQGSEAARLWVVQWYTAGSWRSQVVPGGTTTLLLPETGSAAQQMTRACVRAVDTSSNISNYSLITINASVGDWSQHE